MTIYQSCQNNKKKRKQTRIEKYGVEHHLQNVDILEKQHTTNINRYGVEFQSQRSDFKEKVSATSIEKRGVAFHTQDPLVQEKAKKTRLEKYGYEWFPIIEKRTSKGEEQIRECLADLGLDFVKSRKLLSENREIDLFNESRKIAIEYCGLYWHCMDGGNKGKITKDYHYQKWKQCADNGIDLITIYDTEWNTRNDQVKNFLKARLGIFDSRIYSRDCEFRQLEPQREFFERNHIQGGNIRSHYNFGLFHKNDLVACVSYGPNSRQTSESNAIYLNRLAFESNTQVLGGASKLLKNSIRVLKENGALKIVTFSDNRWSNGKIYENVGFNFDKYQEPKYIYYKLGTNKFETRSAQSMIELTKGGNEKEKALELGWSRVYDCGKKRWVLE